MILTLEEAREEKRKARDNAMRNFWNGYIHALKDMQQDKEVFIFKTNTIGNNTAKAETVIAGHLRNGWKIEGTAYDNMTLVVVFSRGYNKIE